MYDLEKDQTELTVGTRFEIQDHTHFFLDLQLIVLEITPSDDGGVPMIAAKYWIEAGDPAIAVFEFIHNADGTLYYIPAHLVEQNLQLRRLSYEVTGRG